MRKIHRYSTLFTAACFLLSLISCSIHPEDDRPNIILIMADDMGFECLEHTEVLHIKLPTWTRSLHKIYR